MKLDKLFGSKAKADILKYLVFRRQGISMRAFEAELERSYPAIEKQIKQLEDAWVIEIQKNSNKRAIFLTKGLGYYIKDLMLYMLQLDLRSFFGEHELMIHEHFMGKLRWKELDMDLVIVHTVHAWDYLPMIKQSIEEIFREYLLEHVTVRYMPQDEFEKRNRVADKFVISLMRSLQQKDKKPEYLDTRRQLKM